MSTANFNLEQAFHAALECTPGPERDAFLDKACQNFPECRVQIDRLLDSHGMAERFLEVCPEFDADHSDLNGDPEATKPPRPFEPGDLGSEERLPRYFGGYELLERVAQGGMGVVFKARQVSLNRVVAVKMILSGQFAGQDEVDRFRFEAEAAGKLDHSGIVPVFEVGQTDGQHYFSMAYVDGVSLAAKIKQGPLAPREAATITKKLAVAMQFAHDRGIVHRDLKPGNVLLDELGEPRVTDFGLAKRVEGDSNMTRTGMVLGTPSYMPPEQASGKPIAAGADVYSLGAILYAMLVGQPPFSGDTQLETILRVLQDEPTAVRKIDKSIPRDLEVICSTCLEKDPANRYSSSSELAADLDRFLAGVPIHARNNLSRRVRKWSLREPVLAAHLAATTVLAVIILLSWLCLGRTADDFYVMWRNYAILGLWALVVLVFQKAQNALQTKTTIPYAWAAANPVFLTGLLACNAPPRGSLLGLYFVLIVIGCLFRKIELIAITTIVSLLGIATLVFVFFEKSELTAPSYLLVFSMSFAVSGLVLGMVALRLNRLGKRDL